MSQPSPIPTGVFQWHQSEIACHLLSTLKTFWISDEYGPFITHFDARGRQIGRLSPLDGSLPPELANRIGNRGLEGLTITPDGSTLVAIMQSALHQPDLGGANQMQIV